MSSDATSLPMDCDLVQFLGEDSSIKNHNSIKVNGELKLRWEKWMQIGYPEEEKVKLLNSNPRTENLYTEAPKLNPEINSILNEYAIKRDKHLAETQNCVGSAISTLAGAISMILDNQEDDIDKNVLLKYLCDTGKLLTDIFFHQSASRRSCINPLLNKSIKSTIDKSVADEWLYGKNFAENIKEAKELEKASSSIKLTTSKRNPGNSKYPPAKYNQVGYQNKTSMKFKPKTQRAPNNPNSTKKSLKRYPPPPRR